MSYDLANLVIQALIAIGTVGALFAALHQIRKNKEQRDEEQTERIELKARAQADNVAAWFGEGGSSWIRHGPLCAGRGDCA